MDAPPVPAWTTRVLTILLFVVFVAAPAAQAQDAWAFEDPVLVSEGLRHPVDIAFGRDGYLYFASLTKTEIHRIDLGTGARDESFVVELPDADWQPGSETGTFGLELHPEFHANGILFVSYSHNESGEWTNVLSRVTLQDVSGAATEEVLMVRPGAIFHNGGRVIIADDHLWWTTGDASNPFQQEPAEGGRVAQIDGDMRGKVLRLTLDGEPAPGNPWGDAAYTKGHRNVYGIAWDPESERMMVTENGNARHDYAYILEAGGNYGWPECEGACEEPDPRYIDPIWQSRITVAPTGLAAFRGAFWFGTFNTGDLMRVHEADEAWHAEKVHHYPGTDKYPPRIVDVQVGPDGESLWFSTWTEVWRVPFPEDQDHPPFEAIADAVFWWNGTHVEDTPETRWTTPAPDVAVLLGAVAIGVACARRRV